MELVLELGVRLQRAQRHAVHEVVGPGRRGRVRVVYDGRGGRRGRVGLRVRVPHGRPAEPVRGEPQILQVVQGKVVQLVVLVAAVLAGASTETGARERVPPVRLDVEVG